MGGGCLWTEVIQSFPLFAPFVSSELARRVAGPETGCDRGGRGEVLFSADWDAACTYLCRLQASPLYLLYA